MIVIIACAGIGAIFGALIRYVITDYGKKHWGDNFPWATLMINLSGAFLLGVFFSLHFSSLPYTLLGTGVMGGYTTFSTLNVELLNELKQKARKKFWIYGICSYLGGFGLVFLGFLIGTK